MWGASIVGFGSYHYKYASGREGDAPLVGMASRSKEIVFYIGGEGSAKEELLAKLGKHKSKGGCVYIQNTQDIDIKTFIQLVKFSINYRKKNHAN